jgi:hypothetical protein
MADNIPMGLFSGADETKALQESIEKYQAENSVQTQKMVRLTVAITWLTVILTIGLFVQIGLALLALYLTIELRYGP